MADYVNRNRDDAGIDSLTKFDVFMNNHRYTDSFTTGYAFVFVTKPSLFINPFKLEGSAFTNLERLSYENMTKDHLFSQFLNNESMNESDKLLVQQLSYKNFNNPDIRNFIPLFTNKIRNFQITDTTIGQNENFDTRHGFRMPLPTHKVDSIGSGSLSINCYETYNLDFMKMMSIWVNYASNVTDGTFHGNPEMIKNGVIDYMSSVYYFVLAPDGKTLKYWSKYTGVWPTTIPSSVLSFTRGEQNIVELDLQFAYTSKEDMNPSILEDFNRLSLNYFEDRTLNIEEDIYPSIKRSILLNPESLKNNVNFDSQSRGPLVFYKIGKNESLTNPDDISNSFELTFGENVYKDNFIYNNLEEDYFFNKVEEFFSSSIDTE